MVNKKAFLFPGQGSQYIGMGKALCEKYEIARQTYEEANDALSFDLSGLCFKGELSELTLTKNAQPAILTASVAVFRILQEKGITPQYLAGHSLGEISALTCAGVFRFCDAVQLARTRGALMQEAVPKGKGAMAAVMTRDVAMLRELCESVANGQVVVISNYNTRTQQVISGEAEAVQRAVDKLSQMDIKTKLLNVSAPFHCPLMTGAAERFAEVLRGVEIHDPKYPVIANINAAPYGCAETVIASLTKQIVSPVQWADSMTFLKKSMVKYCVEVGTGHVLKNMMKTNISDIPVFAFDGDEEALYEHVKAATFPLVSRAMGLAVATRNRNWDEEAYRQGVVLPYQELAKMQGLIEQESRAANEAEVSRAIELLLTIFKTKQAPVEEQVNRLQELFDDCGMMELKQSFDYSAIRA